MATSTTFLVKLSCCKQSLLLLILGYGFQLICVNCSRSSAITMDSSLTSSGTDKTLQEDKTLLFHRYVPQDENLVQIGDASANANANAKFGDKPTQPLNLAMPSHLRTNVPQDESLVPLAQSDAIINANVNAKFVNKPNVPLNLALLSHLRTNVPQGENSYLLADGAQGHPRQDEISYRTFNGKRPHLLNDGGHLLGIVDGDDNLHLMEYGDNLPRNKVDDGFLRSPTHEEHSFLIDDGANHTPNKATPTHLVGVHQSTGHTRFIDNGFLRSPTHEENSKLLDDGIKSTSNEDESSLLDNNSLQSPKHEEHPYFLDYGYLRSPTKEENSNLLKDGTLGRPSLGRSRSCSINPMACEENAHILGLATTPRCCGGSCVDISSSPNHCGACHNSCPLHLTCCNGKCTDLNSDPNNCGKCNQQYEVCHLGMGPYY